MQGLHGEQIERRQRVRQTLRISQRIGDRHPHVRNAELGQHGTVVKLNHGMNNALRVHDDLKVLDRHVKKPVRLNQLKTLVHHRGGVDRDFWTHFPVRVLERLDDADGPHALQRPVAKRPAGGRQQDTAQRRSLLILQDLKDGVVLAVNGDNSPPPPSVRTNDQLPRHHQGFLVRQRHVQAGMDSAQGRP